MKGDLPKRASVRKLTEILERSEKIVRIYIAELGLKSDGRHMYEVQPLLELKREKQTRKTQAAAVDLDNPQTWSDLLKAKQIEKLDVQINEIAGRLVPVEEMREVVSSICNSIRSELGNYTQLVAAETRDPKHLKIAKAVERRMLESLQATMEDMSR
jgi:hypothetical protein